MRKGIPFDNIKKFYSSVSNNYMINRRSSSLGTQTHRLNNNFANYLHELNLSEPAVKYLREKKKVDFQDGKGNRILSREDIIKTCYILNKDFECNIDGETCADLLASAGYHRLHSREISELCYRYGLDKNMSFDEVETLIDSFRESKDSNRKNNRPENTSTYFLKEYTKNNANIDIFKKFISKNAESFSSTIMKTFEFIKEDIFKYDKKIPRNFLKFYSEIIDYDLSEYYNNDKTKTKINNDNTILLLYLNPMKNYSEGQESFTRYESYEDYFLECGASQLIINMNDLINKIKNISRSGFILLILYAWDNIKNFEPMIDSSKRNILDALLIECRFDVLVPDNIYFDEFICRCLEEYDLNDGLIKFKEIICEYCRYAYYHSYAIPIRSQICEREQHPDKNS